MSDVLAVDLIVMLLASAAPAAPPTSPAGEWVVMAGKTALMLIHLERNTTGLEGAVTRPRAFDFGTNQTFSGLEGPPIVERIERVSSIGDTWESSMPLRPDDVERTVLTLRRDVRGKTQLGWKGVPVDEVPIERSAPGATLPTRWDKDRTYYVDADHPINAELAGLFKADQADRAPGLGGIDWAKVTPG